MIDISIGRPIESTGRQADELMREVEAWIEAEMRRLDPEAYPGERARIGNAPSWRPGRLAASAASLRADAPARSPSRRATVGPPHAAGEPPRRPRGPRIAIALPWLRVARAPAQHRLRRRPRRPGRQRAALGRPCATSMPRWARRAPGSCARLVEQRELAARTSRAASSGATAPRCRFLGESAHRGAGAGLGDGTGATVLKPAAVSATGSAALPRRLHVGLPGDAAAEQIRDAVQSWLQRQARRIFEERVAVFAERLGVRVTRLGLSSARTRWGSASANGAVRLHWRLIHFTPADDRLRRRPRARTPARDEPRPALLGSGALGAAPLRHRASRAARRAAEPGRLSRRTPSGRPLRAASSTDGAEAEDARRVELRASLPSNHSACRWAIDSPIAKVVWCRSSLRLNSTGSSSAALCGASAQASSTSAKRSRVVRLQLADARVQADERPAVRRQHQRVGRQSRAAARSTRDRAAADWPRARPRRTLTLVEMRGSTMSPLISTPSAASCSAMCSGAWP